MKYCIITGGSKGLGEGIALKFKKEGFFIKSIARTTSTLLSEQEQEQFDFYNVANIEKNFLSVLDKILEGNPVELLLINNAGTLGTVDRLENNTVQSIQQAITLNVTIPLALSALFINQTQHLSITKTIINISSGAAISPYYGWSAYCSSKAAIDMATKVIALEQETALFPVRILAIYPGVVDTDMQKEIRSKNTAQFAPVERFIELKENKLLSTPTQSAEAIFNLFKNKKINSGSIVDVRND